MFLSSTTLIVSQSTADLLTAAGKKHWLTAREDLVEAKGKGKMQVRTVGSIPHGINELSFEPNRSDLETKSVCFDANRLAAKHTNI